MLPPRRKAIPPNISFSVISLRPASALRTRAAWACENVMGGGRTIARGFKNHDPSRLGLVGNRRSTHDIAGPDSARISTPPPLGPVGMPTLEVRGLAKSIDGQPVLKDVTFGLQDGELAAILGPSGGGKTTLFRCILGELTPEAGEIFIDGQEVGQLPTERRGIGVVYQSFALFPHLSVADNIGYGLRARRVPADTAHARISEMLDLVHLQGKENRFPRELSGGERQRVALARALCVGPRILLLDEAFGSLDATMRTQVVQEVRSIIRRQKVTTLFITHDQEEAFMFARRMIVLNDGRVVASGSPETMMKNSDPFIQDFMKMVLFAEATVQMGPDGSPYITLDGGAKIPVHITDVRGGEKVHVKVKQGAEAERIEVWQRDAKYSVLDC